MKNIVLIIMVILMEAVLIHLKAQEYKMVRGQIISAQPLTWLPEVYKVIILSSTNDSLYALSLNDENFLNFDKKSEPEYMAILIESFTRKVKKVFLKEHKMKLRKKFIQPLHNIRDEIASDYKSSSPEIKKQKEIKLSYVFYDINTARIGNRILQKRLRSYLKKNELGIEYYHLIRIY